MFNFGDLSLQNEIIYDRLGGNYNIEYSFTY